MILADVPTVSIRIESTNLIADRLNKFKFSTLVTGTARRGHGPGAGHQPQVAREEDPRVPREITTSQSARREIQGQRPQRGTYACPPIGLSKDIFSRKMP